MGSVDGGLSETYTLTGVGQEIDIPLPTTSSDLIDSVLLYNMSPYLIEVNCGVSSQGWLGPYMVDKFKIGSKNTVNCTLNAIAGQNPNAPILVAVLTAAFIMTSEVAENAGSYPIALLSSASVIQASELLIVDPATGHPEVQIGPSPEIQVVNPTATQNKITIQSSAPQGPWPTIDFDTSTTTPPWPSAFINAVPDANTSPQLGINSGEYVNHYGNAVYGRMYMASGQIEIAAVLESTQLPQGGEVIVFDNGLALGVIDSTGTQKSLINLTDTGNINVTGILNQDQAWQGLALLNGWTASNSAGYYLGLRCYKDATGQVHLDGNIRAPSSGAVSQIATLPAGYAPTTTKIFILLYTANAPQLADLIVRADRAILMSGELGSGNGGAMFVTAQWPTSP